MGLQAQPQLKTVFQAQGFCMKVTLLALTLSCVLAALPVTQVQALSPPPQPSLVPQVSAEFSRSMLDLGLVFLRDQAPGENSMNSPYSVTNALGMVLMGAAGDSAAQLSRVLPGGSNHPGVLDRYMLEISPALNKIQSNVTFRSANRMWLNEAMARSIEPIYSQMTRVYYKSDAALQNFDNPELAAKSINQWIEVRTGGQISNMLSSQQLSSNPPMVLVNAVYFKGLWRTPFSKAGTDDASFTLADGRAMQVPTMHAMLHVRTAQHEGVRWLELPYATEAADPDWVMQIALPAPGQSMAQFQQQLTGAQWLEAAEKLREATLAVDLPRFSMKGATTSLRESLKKQGVVDIFSDKANLIGISRDKNLFVNDVLHRATIEVDEAGTVASAATAVIMGTKAVSAVPRFTVDRPFLFFIVHKPTKTPVFMGRVMNPASGS